MCDDCFRGRWEVCRLVDEFCTAHEDAEHGHGHIVFADYNLEDHHIDFCLALELTPDERIFLNMLKLIPEEQRLHEDDRDTPEWAKPVEVDLNFTNVTPMGPRVLVKRLDAPALQSSLIEVIQQHEEPSQFAVVLAVGKLEQGGIEIGDTVVTKGFAGAPLEIIFEGQPLDAFMLMESDCLLVL